MAEDSVPESPFALKSMKVNDISVNRESGNEGPKEQL